MMAVSRDKGDAAVKTTTHPTPTIRPHLATERGTLDGYEVRCECGEVARFSEPVMAHKHAADHRTYMSRLGR